MVSVAYHGFFIVRGTRSNGGQHDCFSIATKRFFQQPCEDGISVRDKTSRSTLFFKFFCCVALVFLSTVAPAVHLALFIANMYSFT